LYQSASCIQKHRKCVQDNYKVEESTRNICHPSHRVFVANTAKFLLFYSDFENHLIVRLPGLVGPGLRKNVVFDLLNKNNLPAIESRNIYQFYPMVNLWYDIQTAIQHGLSLVHLTAEPVRVSDIARQGFGIPFEQQLSHPLVSYDMRTRHAALFGKKGHYQYSASETIQAIRAYAQSEKMALDVDKGVVS